MGGVKHGLAGLVGLVGLGLLGALALCFSRGGFVVASFEHEDWDGDAEKDQDADQSDGWGRSEVFWAHECDEDGDACQDGEGGDGDEYRPVEDRAVWTI